MKKYILALLLCIILSGCSSLGCTLFSGAHPYCGTRAIVQFMTFPFHEEGWPCETDGVGWFLFSLLLGVDLGPSLAMDTILLPYTCISTSEGLSGTPYLNK